MYVYGVCVCLHVHALMDKSERAVETRGEPRIPPTLFFEIGSLTSLELTEQVRLACQESLGSTCLCLFRARITGVSHYVWLFLCVLGDKLRFSCLCGKQST